MTTNNHPAHGPVSLDRLHQISEILSKASAQSDGGNLGYAMADAVKVIDGAIAAMNANPVAWRYRYVHTPKTEEHGSPFTTEWKLCDSEDECNPSDCFERQPLYTAPPAPVVPAEIEPDYEVIKAILPTANPDEYACCIAADMWNACRAAMLQAEPVSNRDELPLDYLQGQKDGLEWAAQLAEANHPQTGDWLYDDPIELARAIRKGPDMPTSQDGNSPVTPDTWIPVSDRMPDKLIPVMVMYQDGEMWSAMWNGNRWDDGTEYPDPHSVTHWREMPAAPQQE
ncbi:DUF551 domain-containing protein [Citrobacter portucalensis]|uniref:DUF551 domain-containing protein n=1 Tax=Citrobacter portucalensis TaxID=1639133 RepID=UPI003983B3C9